MSDLIKLMELSGITPKREVLEEYVNGGMLDKILIVCNPVGENATIEDCMKEVSPKELFLLAKGSDDIEKLDPAFYYPRATGVAKKDAKSRIEALEHANELIRNAEDLAKQATEAAKLAGLVTSDEQSVEQSVEPEVVPVEPEVVPVEAEPEVKPEEEEIASDVQKVEEVKEVKEAAGEGNGSLDSAVNAEVTDELIQPRAAEDSKAPKEITVPADVTKDLKDCIAEHNKLSDYFKEQGKSQEQMNHAKIVECAEQIQAMINEGSKVEFDKAVLYQSGLQNQIQLGLPTSLKKWLMYGGGTGRSLKDYFASAKNK